MDEGSTFEVTAQSGRKGVWRLSLDAAALTLAAVEGDESFHISRTDAEDKTTLRDLRFTKPFLVVSIPKKKVMFQLERAQAASFKEWLGPPTIRGLKAALRPRIWFFLPVGIVIALSSIPLPADPVAELEAVPFNPISAFLGVSLIVLSILTRLWPRRVLFFLEGVWFLLAILNTTVDIFRGDSTWWAILVILLILAVKGSFSEYKRFASVSCQ